MFLFKRASLILMMCMLCASIGHAVPITSPELEAEKGRATQEVRDLTPVATAIKHAAEGEHRFFSAVMDVVTINGRSGARCASGAIGVICKEACYLGKQGKHDANDVLGEYNMALLALPNSPYAKGCVPNDENAYKKIQQKVIQALGMTQESYDAARQKAIEKYRIFDIAFENDLAALESYTGDLNVQDVSGRNALYYAVGGKNLEMFTRLLKMGIDTTTDKDLFAQITDTWNTEYRQGHQCHVLRNAPFAQSFIEHAKDISTQDTAYYLSRAGRLDFLSASLKKYPQEKAARTVKGMLESCRQPKDILQVLRFVEENLKDQEIIVPMSVCWPFLRSLSYDALDVLGYLAHMGVRVVPDKDALGYIPGYCTGYEPAHLRNRALEMLGKLQVKQAESPPPPREGVFYVPNIKE